MKRLIVAGLERSCTATHWVTLHRPWLWFFNNCPLATLSGWLDERWHTGHWTEPKVCE